MPELPEVETLRRSLEPHLRGRLVLSATLHRRDILILPGDPQGGFSRSRTAQPPRPRRACPDDLLQGAVIAALDRRGKQLAILADNGRALVVQLGMSGQLLVQPGSPEAEPNHVHASWQLRVPLPDGGEDGEKGASGLDPVSLLFRDPRRFGALRAFPSRAALDAHWSSLGPDALSITADSLALRLANKDTPIKAALLDQAVLAGVGNIYADEALFQARIYPLAAARRLSPPQTARLAAAVCAVLSRAIAARGSTLRDYRDANGQTGEAQLAHEVYGRAGCPCVRCSSVLVAIQAAQRTTTYCPTCQPRRRRLSDELIIRPRKQPAGSRPAL